MRHERIHGDSEAAHKVIMEEARSYGDWFRRNFSTLLCRERTGVDFYKASSWIRYILPGNRVSRCFWQIGKSASYLKDLSTLPVPSSPVYSPGSRPVIHCATEVLKGVHAQCGVGNDLLEKTACVLDGGVAFSGGVCGAMAGAVMALNLVHGWDIHRMSYLKTIQAFVKGHVNLIVKEPSGKPESFSIGRALVKRLIEKTTGLECCHITQKRFFGWDDFQEHIQSSQMCTEIINEAVAAASEAINKHRPL
jgi:hypothetical protein